MAIPSKVMSINTETNMAVLDTLGVQREASLDLMQDDVAIGDFVLLHVGYVMGKIDAADAAESLKLYAQMVAAIEEEDEELQLLEQANNNNKV